MRKISSISTGIFLFFLPLQSVSAGQELSGQSQANQISSSGSPSFTDILTGLNHGGDENERKHYRNLALTQLPAYKGPDAHRLWATALGNPEPQIAHEALGSLKKIMEADKLGLTIQIFENSTDAYASSLVKLLSEYDGKNIVDIYSRLLSNPNPAAHASAIHAMYRSSEGSQQEHLIAGLLQSHDPRTRESAVDGLRTYRGPKLNQFFEKALGDEHAPVSKKAGAILTNLQKLDEKSGYSLFAHLIESKIPRVSENALTSLSGFIGSDDPEKVILALLQSTEIKKVKRNVTLDPSQKDENGNIRDRFRDKVTGKIIENTQTIEIEEPSTKLSLVLPIVEKVLPKYSGYNGNRIFAEVFRIKDPNARLKAIEVLNNFESSKRIDVVKKILSSEDPSVRRAMSEYLHQSSGKNVDQLFKTLLEDPLHYEVAVAALSKFAGTPLSKGHLKSFHAPELASSTTEKSEISETDLYRYQIFKTLLNDSNPKVRQAAATSLKGFISPGQQNLYLTALKDKESKVKAAAEVSLLNQAGSIDLAAATYSKLLQEVETSNTARQTLKKLEGDLGEGVLTRLLKSPLTAVQNDALNAQSKSKVPQIRESRVLKMLSGRLQVEKIRNDPNWKTRIGVASLAIANYPTYPELVAADFALLFEGLKADGAHPASKDLKTEHFKMNKAAVKALSLYVSPDGARAYRILFRHPNPEVRFWAAQAFEESALSKSQDSLELKALADSALNNHVVTDVMTLNRRIILGTANLENESPTCGELPKLF